MDSRAGISPQIELPRDAASRPRTLSLLVIDDDAVHRMVIGKVGEKAGYALTTASSVEDAIGKLAQQKFDCISLDLSLGGQSGLLVLESIAQNNKDALLIIISGATADVREATLASAHDLHIHVMEAPKPVDLIALRARLNEHIEAARA
jgi:CheY-like chemotaxis protein